jgi:hypothetical protein
MSFNAKNYNPQGGDRTVIGGELTIISGGKIKVEDGAAVEGLQTEAYTLPSAGETIGGVRRTPSQSDSAAETVAELAADFNALLAKLRAAGIVAPEPAGE